MARFGAPTLAWETRLDYPHLWGTRRIGPDLSRARAARDPMTGTSRISSRRRAVVPQSVMPAYPRLFDGAPDRPRQEARDLVAYLNTLGRARELAGPEGEARARAACNCADDEMAQMAFHGPLNAHPARTRRVPDAPTLPAPAISTRGRQLYAAHCATCHGPRGEGDGPGAAGCFQRRRILQNTITLPSGLPPLCGTAWRGRPCRRGEITRSTIWRRWSAGAGTQHGSTGARVAR